MRVITGTARGKKLETLGGNDVRPTVDRVKEAVFSIIQFQTEGRAFLDLFAGSGQMGIEALSRGAKEAYFVDQSRKALEVTKRNLKSAGLEKNAKVFLTDARSFLRTNAAVFDIAFLDPPYDLNLIEECLEPLSAHMSAGGIILCETKIERKLAQRAGSFEQVKEYRYGKIKITAYRRKEGEQQIGKNSYLSGQL